jgi:MFS family permease
LARDFHGVNSFISGLQKLIPVIAESQLDRRRVYAWMTASYWGFTVSDGALRMLVLLHFYQLGFSPLQIASLFLFYEFFGIVTNLFGGWIANRTGLKLTLTGGLLIQIVALVMLALLDPAWAPELSVAYVMLAQALSGIAKDLVKMSSKSSVKLLVQENRHSALFKWVAVLTGSKNALKGAGFFVGGLLLSSIGFQAALTMMATVLLLIWLAVLFGVRDILKGAATGKKVPGLLSKSAAINRLSAARFFLFGSRDIWFVVGLPIFLSTQFDWSHAAVGAFLAAWVIGYGLVQMLAPVLVRESHLNPAGKAAWSAFLLLIVLGAMIMAIRQDVSPIVTIVAGLGAYGFIFAINSSIHSYLVLAYGQRAQIAMDVGFYYMANAGGRLTGTLLSGLLYQVGGLLACLVGSLVFVLLSWLLAMRLPQIDSW